MRSASDQLAKCAAFDQMRNVWQNAQRVSSMQNTEIQPGAVDELRNVFGHWRKESTHAPQYAIRRNRCDTLNGKL